MQSQSQQLSFTRCNNQNSKPFWLKRLVRLNKAVLYSEEIVIARILDYGYLINSAGEILDYD